MTRLLIVGATGLVGQRVLQQALADERVSHVVALTRRPIAPSTQLENVVLDFAALPERAGWWCVDGVVCALGTTRALADSPAAYRAVDFDYPLLVARRTRAQGATRFALTSSLGADPRSRFVYTRTKGELELELENLAFPSLTIVRPSVLGGSRPQPRLGERLAQIAVSLLAPLLPARLRVSQAGTVAATLLEAAIAGPPGLHLKHNDDMQAS